MCRLSFDMLVMYTFQQKREKSKEIADSRQIEEYRRLLRNLKHPAAGRRMLDRQELAVSLVYELLGIYTAEELSGLLNHKARPSAETSKPETQENIHRKASKFEEYPDIAWRSMDNPQVRIADSIYSDRINLHQELRQIERDTEGANELDATVLESIVSKSIRLELCFSELRSFNKTGEFLSKHPFISQKDERTRIKELMLNDPNRYFEERMNVEMNIKRYSSQINGKKASAEVRQRAGANLERFKIILALYEEVFDEFIKSRTV